ncbi:MAG: hypothetical protein OXC28_12645 [Defluviicoccus sp.]|nr:hypothetical protein [Defluviicoccus sp.]
MSRNMNPITVCCAAVLMLGLAACGSDDDDGGTAMMMEPEMPEMPVPEPMVQYAFGGIDGAAVAKAIGEGEPETMTAVFTVDGETLEPAAMAAAFTAGMTVVPEIPGWAGSVHTRANGSVATTVVNYTDIEAATDAKYSEYYSVDAAGTRDLVASATAAGVLTLDVDALSNADERALFGIDRTGLTADGTTTRTNPEIDGRFNGIPGKFECAGSCSITSVGDNVTATMGTWTFTPTADVAGIVLEGVVPDPEYLNLAVWLTSTTARDGTVSHEIGTFGQSNDATGYGTVAMVAGTASYAGPATGIYLRKTFDPDGNVTPAAAGQFVADAELTAYFGEDDNVAAVDQNTIKGTVDNFRDSAGETISENWTLTLARSGKFATATPAGSFSGITEAPEGQIAAEGTWSGQFQGEPGANNAIPSGATGVFHGHFVNGHVAGAFAVEKED